MCSCLSLVSTIVIVLFAFGCDCFPYDDAEYEQTPLIYRVMVEGTRYLILNRREEVAVYDPINGTIGQWEKSSKKIGLDNTYQAIVCISKVPKCRNTSNLGCLNNTQLAGLTYIIVKDEKGQLLSRTIAPNNTFGFKTSYGLDPIQPGSLCPSYLNKSETKNLEVAAAFSPDNYLLVYLITVMNEETPKQFFMTNQLFTENGLGTNWMNFSVRGDIFVRDIFWWEREQKLLALCEPLDDEKIQTINIVLVEENYVNIGEEISTVDQFFEFNISTTGLVVDIPTTNYKMPNEIQDDKSWTIWPIVIVVILSLLLLGSLLVLLIVVYAKEIKQWLTT